jgi:hypothetical protein
MAIRPYAKTNSFNIIVQPLFQQARRRVSRIFHFKIAILNTSSVVPAANVTEGIRKPGDYSNWLTIYEFNITFLGVIK